MITIIDQQFREALQAYLPTTKRSLSEVLNRRAYVVAGRTLDSMKPEPGREQSERRRIRSYLNSVVSTRLKVFKGGKRKGQFGRAGARANQLARVNLIIQKRRSKMGLKGLYGQEMITAEGKFKQAAQVGVGYLKSPFVAVVRDLRAYIKGPIPRIRTSWGRISIWPGSKGRGLVNPANPGINPAVVMQMKWQTKGHASKVESLTVPHLQAAFNAEAAEIMEHVRRKMQADADKINARK